MLGSVLEFCHGATGQLEGFFEAVLGLLRHRAWFQATSTRERIRFNIINRETGNRVRYRQIDAETGEEVPEEDRVKGYKMADGSYVLLEPEELDEVALESTHTIDIESFVPRKEIDEIYLDDAVLPLRPTTKSASRPSR